jgi:glycosyltransferase involved in cell wall biosynthesis
MKVAVLTFHSFEHVKGGTELFCEHLKKAFPDLTLITYHDVNRSSLPSLSRFNLEEARMGMAISRRFRRLLKEQDFDLAICNSTAGWWLSVVKPDVPVMSVFHYTMKGLAEGTLRGTPGYLPSRYFLPLFEKAAARSNAVVAVSNKVHRELQTDYGIRSRVIENGIDLERFRPMDRIKAREQLGIQADGPLAIFVGRADHTKGFDLVKELPRLRPDMKILCVTQHDIQGKGMIVRHNVPNDLLPLYYSAADLLLFPSRYESFGFTPLEAMACGVPVVATKTGIFEDLQDDRAGVVLSKLNVPSLLEGVDQVLNGSYNPRAVVGERFSLDRFVVHYRAAAREAAELRSNGKKGYLDTAGW